MRSTHKQSNRYRLKKSTLAIEWDAASTDAVLVPVQAPANTGIHTVYMLTAELDGFICSNQTGMFPHISNRGMKYVCIFYIYDANYINSVPLKSRKKE